MRIRTDHGPEDWTLNQPATPLASRHISGALVIGARGANDRDRRNEWQRQSKAKTRVAKAAA